MSSPGAALTVDPCVTFTALPGIPLVQAGDDLGALIGAALGRAKLELVPGDVLVVTSKLFSRSEGRFVDLSQVDVSSEAATLAQEVDKDPALVQLILDESQSISRKRPGVLIVRHRLGFISANAAIDASNASPADAPAGSGPWALLLPLDPDESARQLLTALGQEGVGVVVSDSLGRPFRVGAHSRLEGPFSSAAKVVITPHLRNRGLRSARAMSSMKGVTSALSPSSP